MADDNKIAVVPQPVQDSVARMERHKDRFIKHRGGMTFEAIAKQEDPNARGGKLRSLTKEVENSVKVVQAYRAYSSLQEVETAQQGIVVSASDEEENMLKLALKATVLEDNGKGELVRVPDWDVRFRASELLTAKYGIAAKKGGGLNIGVAVQNAPPAAKSSPEPQVTVTTSFEDVLRGVREKRRAAAENRPPLDEKLLGDGGIIEAP